MKTKQCKPALVEKKELPHFGDLCFSPRYIGKILIFGNFENSYQDECKKQELILISLDPDDKIEEGELVYIDLAENSRITKVISLEGKHPIYNIDIEEGCAQLTSLKKIVAIQSQLSPEYRMQFIEEYNKGEVKDVEIELEITVKTVKNNGWLYETTEHQSKLTNGFITIVQNEFKIGAPYDDYVRAKHSIDECIGFIDGYNARRSEESKLYTELEVKTLFEKCYMDLYEKELSLSDLLDWFNQNKKKYIIL